jgi:hypothetical protein
LRYLYSGSIFFRPLRSTHFHGPNDTAATIKEFNRSKGTAFSLAEEEIAALAEYGARSVGTVPLPLFSCVRSPKSVFALADKLGMEDLKPLAHHQIIASLTVDNALEEASSPFSALFDSVRLLARALRCAYAGLQIRKEQLRFIKGNWVRCVGYCAKSLSARAEGDHDHARPPGSPRLQRSHHRSLARPVTREQVLAGLRAIRNVAS